MPLMHLTSVDLPAPLSPTSAVTSPGKTESPTSCRTWTGPKLLSIPRNSRRGVAATGGSPSLDAAPPIPGRAWAAPSGPRFGSADAVFGAELGEIGGAELV